MVNPAPRPATAHRAPTLKLWTATVPIDNADAQELLRVGYLVEVAVYVLSTNKIAALDMLHERIAAIGETGRGLEASPELGWPEIAQAMKRDDPETMTTPCNLFVVHGRRVVAVDSDGHATLAGTYAHRAKRYHPMTPADRLGEDIAAVSALADRGRAMSEAEQAALWRIVEIGRERQRAMREREEDGGRRSAFEACLDDSADTSSPAQV